MNFEPEKSLEFISKNINDKWSIDCYLSTQRNLVSTLESPKEIWSALLILWLLHKYLSKDDLNKIIEYTNIQKDKDWSFHFFEDKSLLPNDTDTTSRWLSTQLDLKTINLETAIEQAQKIANNADEFWIIQTYYKEYQRERIIDPTAILNILHFLHKVGLNIEEYEKSYKYVQETIESRWYQSPWRYYFSPWMFLFFLQRLWVFNNEIMLQLQKIMKEEKIPIQWTIDKACSIIVKKSLGLDFDNDITELLKEYNHKEWSFSYDSIYKYWSKNLYFWSKPISTAFALHAILKT
jgi:hypothetical protein